MFGSVWVESTTGAVTVGRGEWPVPAAFAHAGASFRTLAPFPAAARRTGRADFPHPALGRGLMPSPTEGHAYAPTAAAAPDHRRGARQGSAMCPDPAVCVSCITTGAAARLLFPTLFRESFPESSGLDLYHIEPFLFVER